MLLIISKLHSGIPCNCFLVLEVNMDYEVCIISKYHPSSLIQLILYPLAEVYLGQVLEHWVVIQY